MAIEDTRPGDILIDENRTLWRCVLWVNEPTMTLETVEVDQQSECRLQRSGVVTAPIFKGFTRLMPENRE